MKKYKFLLLSNSLLLFAFLFFGGLFFAREFLIPFCFAALLAMLMLPICQWLEKKGIYRGISIFICILIIILSFSSVIFVLSAQIASFNKDIPQMKEELENKADDLQSLIASKANISYERQISFLKARLSLLSESADTFAKDFVLATTGTIVNLALIAIYIFFFMYYRDKFQNFVLKITQKNDHTTANEVMGEISHVTQKYLSGVIIVILILSVLNSVGLLIIGVKHAVFFGCLAALLNIVPYIGVLIGSLFPIIMVLLTKESIWAAIAVAGVFTFNQFLDNNFLTPNIVGSQVKVNPLTAIMALIIGGLIWGVAGMILFIPFLGIVKIIFDNVESLEPYAYLIGEDENSTNKKTFTKIKSWFTKK